MHFSSKNPKFKNFFEKEIFYVVSTRSNMPRFIFLGLLFDGMLENWISERQKRFAVRYNFVFLYAAIQFFKKSMNVRFRLPWNQQTIFGYVMEASYISYSSNWYYVISLALVVLFVPICWQHYAFHKIFEYKMNQFNNAVEHRNDKKFLCDLIRFHISIKK